MRKALIFTLLLAVCACANGRLEQMEERIADLEEKVEGWPWTPTVFNPDGCIPWPECWGGDVRVIPSLWPVEDMPLPK